MTVTARIRSQVLDRDEFMCVRCGTYVGPFGDYSIHHRRPRGMGGTKRPETDLPANLLTLCGSGTTGCHGQVESDRLEAISDGYLVGQTIDPATIPVRTHRGMAYLDNDGMLTLTADPEVDA